MDLRQIRTARVDQVGSLIRLEPLRQALIAHQEGRLGDKELHAAQDDAVRAVITRQESIGFPIVTDGEFRRENFQESFARSTSGWGGDATAIVTRQPVAGRLKLTHNTILDEYRFSASVASNPVKVTVISPDRIWQRFDWQASEEFYPDAAEFMQEVAAIEHQMVGDLVRAGCSYVQIDAPSYTAYVDAASIAEFRARGEDPAQNMERSMAADNAVIAGYPDTVFGIHLCRGNTIVPHRYGFYDDIAERLFNTLKHQRLLLEYDTERAGTFEPLRFVPKDKIVVLGLVSTKVPEVESADDLARRIDEASQYIPLDQLALSPQCGFASGGATGTPKIPEEQQWRKLERILEVARRVWGDAAV
jgi:5-methyltetrahydropteroyltriglutamate--homocysteine methyltransferase